MKELKGNQELIGSFLFNEFVKDFTEVCKELVRDKEFDVKNFIELSESLNDKFNEELLFEEIEEEISVSKLS